MNADALCPVPVLAEADDFGVAVAVVAIAAAAVWLLVHEIQERRKEEERERRRREAEARRKAETERKRREDEARRKAEAERKRREDEARRRDEAERKRREDEARRKAEAEEIKREWLLGRQKALRAIWESFDRKTREFAVDNMARRIVRSKVSAEAFRDGTESALKQAAHDIQFSAEMECAGNPDLALIVGNVCRTFLSDQEVATAVDHAMRTIRERLSQVSFAAEEQSARKRLLEATKDRPEAFWPQGSFLGIDSIRAVVGAFNLANQSVSPETGVRAWLENASRAADAAAKKEAWKWAKEFIEGLAGNPRWQILVAETEKATWPPIYGKMLPIADAARNEVADLMRNAALAAVEKAKNAEIERRKTERRRLEERVNAVVAGAVEARFDKFVFISDAETDRNGAPLAPAVLVFRVLLAGGDLVLRPCLVGKGKAGASTVYYVPPDLWRRLHRECRPICRLLGAQDYGVASFDRFKQESIVRQMGYNVSRDENLSHPERMAVLKLAVDWQFYGKRELLRFLRGLVSRANGKTTADMSMAIRKWNKDIEMLGRYAPRFMYPPRLANDAPLWVPARDRFGKGFMERLRATRNCR